MNCADFDRWLGEGSPHEAEVSARAHAESCPRCAMAMSANREVDRLLAVETPPAPAGFAARVMARIKTEGQVSAAGGWRPALPATPWWVQIAADRATAGALVLLALVIWQIGRLDASARAFASGIPQSKAYDALVQVAAWMGLDTPAVQVGLWICLIPALAWGSFALYRWTERLLSRRARA